MLEQVFLGMALVGSQWVLWLLLLLSIFSVALIVERVLFFREVKSAGPAVGDALRKAAMDADWEKIRKTAKAANGSRGDFESSIAVSLAELPDSKLDRESIESATRDALLRTRITWEKNLATLATIGSNAPFVGLFGTVLGIIQAFHDLSQKAGASGGVQGVTAGISEALIATAVGLFVAIPAVVAFNLFQRRVRKGLTEAEALMSRLAGSLSRK